MRPIELSRAGVNRSRLDRIRDIIHCQPARRQTRWIGLDPDRALHSINVYLRDTGENRDALCYRGGCVFI